MGGCWVSIKFFHIPKNSSRFGAKYMALCSSTRSIEDPDFLARNFESFGFRISNLWNQVVRSSQLLLMDWIEKKYMYKLFFWLFRTSPKAEKLRRSQTIYKFKLVLKHYIWKVLKVLVNLQKLRLRYFSIFSKFV